MTNTIPPEEIKIEAAVLGAVLLESDSIWRVAEVIESKMFGHGPHKRIYAACIALAKDSISIDLLSVSNRLKDWNELESVGGNIYLAELTANVSSAANLTHHVAVLHEHFQKREWAALGNQVSKMTANGVKPDKIALLVQAQMEGIQPNLDANLRPMRVLLSEVEEELAAIEKASLAAKKSGEQYTRGVSTGFRDIDRITNGLKPKTFVIIAARPAMGKTALALQILRNVGIATQNIAVLFCLEMAALMLGMRIVAQKAETDMGIMQRGLMNQRDWLRVEAVMNSLKDSVIWIDDSSSLSILKLRAKVKKLSSKGTLSVIVIDYIQLMSGNDRRSNREQQLSGISRSLKQIAMDFNIPVIALAQLNREVEKRSPPRPKLSDLRESGAMEQDADEVWFLYRPEYYGIVTDEGGEYSKGVAELIIAKQRNGPTGTVKLQWNDASVSFSDIEQFPIIEPSGTRIIPMPNESGENEPF